MTRQIMFAALPLLAGLLTLLAVTIIGAQVERAAIVAHREDVKKALLERATGTAERLTRFTDSIDMVLDLVRLRQSFVDDNQTGPAAEITNQLQHYSGNARLNGALILWLDHDGITRWSSRNVGIGNYDADRDYFSEARAHPGQTFVPAPMIGRTTHTWRIQFVRGVSDPSGKFLGVAMVSTDARQIGDLLASDGQSEAMWSNLVRAEDGIILGRTRDNEQVISRKSKINEALLARARAAPTGTVEMIGGVTGEPLISGYRVMPSTGLIVMASATLPSIDAETTARLRPQFRAISLALPLIAALLTLLIQSGRTRRAEQRRLADLSSLREAEMLARRRVETLIRDLATALFAGEAGPRGGFAPSFVSDNLGRICRLPHFGRHERAQLRDFVREVGRAGEATLTIEAIGHAGQPIWLQVSARRGAARARGRFELLGKISDVTREHAMMDQLLSASKLATLGDLATGIAHELNQPIAVMSFAAENATADLDLPPAEAAVRVRKRLRLIVEQAMRARHIVEHLRAFGRKEDTALVSVSVPTVIEGALLLTQAALYQEQIAVVTDIAPDLPAVLGRAAPLEQALANLITHARDGLATFPGFRKLRLSADVENAMVVIRVADNGPGIPEAQRASIFEPFAPVYAYQSGDRAPASGLGLWLCKGTINRFGGSLTLISPPEGGAMFEVRMTIAQATALSPKLAVVETVR